ncbi:MAG: hypothetical protein KDE01_18085 [Caldilineaceae bacterium]|nr:hypothetical protein [Caldilineaceae bacterium]
MLVDPDDRLHHLAQRLVCQPHAEGLVQPHALGAEQQHAQKAAHQRDEEHQPGRKLFEVAIIVHGK